MFGSRVWRRLTDTAARAVSDQLGHPSGLSGHLMGWVMNRVNAALNRRAVELLAVRPDHHVLEIGFGGGAMLAPLLRLTPEGRVAGVDRSGTMVAAARARCAAALSQGRLSLMEGNVECLPSPAGSFDRVLAVNTVYFWPDPRLALREIHRVLRPEGLLVLGFRPAASMRKSALSRHGFVLRDEQEVLDLLGNTGFDALAMEEGRVRSLSHVCVVARRLS